MLVTTFHRPKRRSNGCTEEEPTVSTNLLLDCSPSRREVSGEGERKARNVKGRWKGKGKRMKRGRRGGRYGKAIEKDKKRGGIGEG